MKLHTIMSPSSTGMTFPILVRKPAVVKCVTVGGMCTRHGRMYVYPVLLIPLWSLRSGWGYLFSLLRASPFAPLFCTKMLQFFMKSDHFHLKLSLWFWTVKIQYLYKLEEDLQENISVSGANNVIFCTFCPSFPIVPLSLRSLWGGWGFLFSIHKVIWDMEATFERYLSVVCLCWKKRKEALESSSCFWPS